eukprot:12085375-Heterocapsa_arctica.AAC.1
MVLRHVRGRCVSPITKQTKRPCPRPPSAAKALPKCCAKADTMFPGTLLAWNKRQGHHRHARENPLGYY